MRYAMTMVLAGAATLVVGCAPAAEGEANETAEAAMEAPAQPPKVAPNESLTKLTCADFLETAKVATTQPADDAALAAQDELANGLTWLHGYLYAARAGSIEPLSREWMATTAKRVFETCSKAEKPAETNLFEVAVS